MCKGPGQGREPGALGKRRPVCRSSRASEPSLCTEGGERSQDDFIQPFLYFSIQPEDDGCLVGAGNDCGKILKVNQSPKKLLRQRNQGPIML